MENFVDRYTDLIVFFTSTLWAAALWYLNRKERNTGIRKTESEAIENLQSALDKVTDDLADLSTKYVDVLSALRSRDEKLNELQEQFDKLKKDYIQLKRRNTILETQLKELDIDPANGS